MTAGCPARSEAASGVSALQTEQLALQGSHGSLLIGLVEVLDFVITLEQNAYDFYIEMSGRADGPAMVTALRDLAEQELTHKAKLAACKQSAALIAAQTAVAALNISDYTVDLGTDAVPTYKQALALAIKQEQAACSLYMDLAAATTSTPLKELFTALAKEEAKHKLRCELVWMGC